MTLLFLPIDLDLSSLPAYKKQAGKQMTAYNPYWSTTDITESALADNDFQKILNQLPFEKVTVLTHKTQERAVGSHIDVYPEMSFQPNEYNHICENEPAGYRILLNGHLDRLQVFNGKEWVTAHVPSSPGCYILNSTRALHKVAADPGRELIYVRGFLNPDKHKELLDRSYAKYKDYAIELL